MPPVWLITGTSSGFGASLALHALHHGHHVISTSRTSTPLTHSIQSLGGHHLTLDVCARSTLPGVIAQAERIYGHIDVLVNCAGVAVLGAVEDVAAEEARRVMETNFWAPLQIVRTLLPGMRSRGKGTVVMVSSTAGQVAGPGVGVYAASKHALEAISESLYHELRPLGIRVLIIQPGGFNTSFAARIAQPAGGMTPDYERTPVAAVLRSIPGLVGNQYGDVEKGARAIFDVVMRSGVAAELFVEDGDDDDAGDGEGKGEEGGDAKGEAKTEKKKAAVEYLRIPLGTDCAQRLRTQYDSLQKGLEATRCVWESTDLDVGDAGGSGGAGNKESRQILDFGR